MDSVAIRCRELRHEAGQLPLPTQDRRQLRVTQLTRKMADDLDERQVRAEVVLAAPTPGDGGGGRSDLSGQLGDQPSLADTRLADDLNQATPFVQAFAQRLCVVNASDELSSPSSPGGVGEGRLRGNLRGAGLVAS